LLLQFAATEKTIDPFHSLERHRPHLATPLDHIISIAVEDLGAAVAPVNHSGKQSRLASIEPCVAWRLS